MCRMGAVLGGERVRLADSEDASFSGETLIVI